MKAEIGAMQPQAKEHLGPQKLEEAKKDSPQNPLIGTQPCRHLDFRFVPSRTVRACCVVLGSLWYFCHDSSRNNTITQTPTSPDLQMLVGPRAPALDLSSSLSTLSPLKISPKVVSLNAIYKLRVPECVCPALTPSLIFWTCPQTHLPKSSMSQYALPSC